MKSKFNIAVTILVATIGYLTIASPPPGAIGSYLDGVFPDTPPGADSKWYFEDPMPDMTIEAPIKILPFPTTEDLLILSKSGIIYQLSLENQTEKEVLNLKDITFKLSDSGMVGMALHPKFGDTAYPDKQVIYIYYKYNPNPEEWLIKGAGMNRLSVLQWNATEGVFDRDSEEVLIQQYDRSSWHDGGGLFFDKDGFLNIAVGDEGHEEFQEDSNQRRDLGFFCGMLRIDVDNDDTKSHPIRRQPLSKWPAPDEWGTTYSQGYMIPNSNPWLAEDGSVLEEFVMLGLRSPYSTHYDAETENIWIADVGSDVNEEINVAAIGDNLQWPYIEGYSPSQTWDIPNNILGVEKEPSLALDRDEVSCIIGGGVYRSDRYQELNEKFIFGNYSPAKLMSMTYNGSNNEATYEVLSSNFDLASVGLPSNTRLAGIYLHTDGHIYVCMFPDGENLNSKILRLRRQSEIPDPPSKLSDLNVFTNLSTLEVRDGILPYQVNSPLWSDGAEKKRWMAVPNDGIFDSDSERIQFESQENWRFPEGTVFIKHFELPLTIAKDGENARLETRFFIIGKGGRGYGLSYKWNDEGTEAYLLGGGASKTFDIWDDEGYAYSQTWEYPSRAQCITCHNENAEYVLGVRTHQLNGMMSYTFQDNPINQIDYMNKASMFTKDIGLAGFHHKSYPIENNDADLETRIRSYLDANCSSCHQNGGVPDVNLDFRYNSSVNVKNYIDFPAASHASVSGRSIITIGEHENSEIWVRDASEESNQMPPLGRTFVDQIYVDSLAKWIDNLDPSDVPDRSQFSIFPNPTTDWIAVRFEENWTAPYSIDINSISGHDILNLITDEDIKFVDLSGIPAGIYIVSVSSGDLRHSAKLVVR